LESLLGVIRTRIRLGREAEVIMGKVLLDMNGASVLSDGVWCCIGLHWGYPHRGSFQIS
jgi:hypothetical protein